MSIKPLEELLWLPLRPLRVRSAAPLVEVPQSESFPRAIAWEQNALVLTPSTRKTLVPRSRSLLISGLWLTRISAANFSLKEGTFAEKPQAELEWEPAQASTLDRSELQDAAPPLSRVSATFRFLTIVASQDTKYLKDFEGSGTWQSWTMLNPPCHATQKQCSLKLPRVFSPSRDKAKPNSWWHGQNQKPTYIVRVIGYRCLEPPCNISAKNTTKACLLQSKRSFCYVVLRNSFLRSRSMMQQQTCLLDICFSSWRHQKRPIPWSQQYWSVTKCVYRFWQFWPCLQNHQTHGRQPGVGKQIERWALGLHYCYVSSTKHSPRSALFHPIVQEQQKPHVSQRITTAQPPTEMNNHCQQSDRLLFWDVLAWFCQVFHYTHSFQYIYIFIYLYIYIFIYFLYFYIYIFLYLYIYIFIYLYIFIFLYLYIYIFIYLYIYIFINLKILKFKYIYFYISIYIYISISLYLYISISLYLYISISLYIYIYIYIYICVLCLCQIMCSLSEHSCKPRQCIRHGCCMSKLKSWCRIRESKKTSC